MDRKTRMTEIEVEAFETEVIQSWLEDTNIAWEKLPAVKKMLSKVGEQGIEQGLEQGLEQGIEKEAIRIASKMIEAGKSNSEIAELTDLPPRTIKKLRGE